MIMRKTDFSYITMYSNNTILECVLAYSIIDILTGVYMIEYIHMTVCVCVTVRL